MLELTMLRYCKPCQAVGLPHSAGRLPVKPMPPNSSVRRAAKEPLLPQDGGMDPVRTVSDSTRVDKDGMPGVLPKQAARYLHRLHILQIMVRQH